MSKKKKTSTAKAKAVCFYRSGALTGAQAAFVKKHNATVHISFSPEEADDTARHVFARKEVSGFELCGNGELFGAL